MRHSLALLAVVAGGALANSAAAADYRAPFATPAPRAVAAARCTPPPAPVAALSLGSSYRAGDSSFSHIDAARQQSRDAQVAPVKLFTGSLATLANRYVASGGRDATSGACVLAWLGAWAKADAMTDMQNHDAQYWRSVNLAAWAIDFAQVRGLSVGGDDLRPAITAWFARMAADMRSHYDGLSNVTARNNHRYWAGLAAAAVAMDTGDAQLNDWALQSARVGIDQIDAGGALPLELARQGRARLYHLYAAAPLVMTAEIAAANGADLYGYRGGALHRLVAFSTASVAAPDRITALAGVAQVPFVNPRGGFYGQSVAWTEFYARRFPGRLGTAAAVIFANRPLINPEIGGDMTMLANPARGRLP